jgi:hypothetical protein
VIAAADDLTRDEAGGWFREHVRPRRRP